MIKPEKFTGKDGKEVGHIKGFEQTCVLLNQHIGKDPKSMTALEFLTALELVKEQLKPKRKRNKR